MYPERDNRFDLIINDDVDLVIHQLDGPRSGSFGGVTWVSEGVDHEVLAA